MWKASLPSSLFSTKWLAMDTEMIMVIPAEAAAMEGKLFFYYLLLNLAKSCRTYVADQRVEHYWKVVTVIVNLKWEFK